MSLFRRKTDDGARNQNEVPTLQESDQWITVMGTFAYPDAVLHGQRKYDDRVAIGALVPVTDGQWAGAVSVYVDGHQIGSMPKELAPVYFPLVQELTKKRTKATVLISFGRDEDVFLNGEPRLRQDRGGSLDVAAIGPDPEATDFTTIPTFSSDPSWMAWPTLLEKHTSKVPRYGGDKSPKVPGIIKQHGHLVMVRFQIEPEGRSGGAIQCWVGSDMICVADNLDEESFQEVIESLAKQGQPATCRGTLQHLDDFDAFSVFGKPERRPEDAPFLPPEDVVSVEVAHEELLRLDELLHSKAKNKTALRVGTLVNHSEGTWLSLDGVWTGLVEGGPRNFVERAVAAGFPATCSVVIRRQADEPLAVSVRFPRASESVVINNGASSQFGISKNGRS